MSILGFLLKPKKEMAKKETKRVKVGKYTITRHAQNRIVERNRKINKGLFCNYQNQLTQFFNIRVCWR